ncbi:MAG: hypothetical protein HY046_00460 [Acidobacteria bacterium]|nr:hypothetical protein [Acidobacteriota bacterium]
MLTKHNPAKRILIGIALTLALGFAASGPAKVAARDGQAEAGVGGVLATLQVAASQAVDGSVQMARDLRSLYSVYQLQSAPELATVVHSATRVEADVVPRAILCEVLTQHAKPEAKKKCRT